MANCNYSTPRSNCSACGRIWTKSGHGSTPKAVPIVGGWPTTNAARKTSWRLRQQTVERLSEQLDHRRATIEQSQAEVTDLHRETLELRLATEELWSQLAGVMTPAALTQALGQTRSRLAQHFRLSLSEIDNRRAELEALRSEMAIQHGQLASQSQELQDWVAARESELAEQAGRLAVREEELETLATDQRRAQEQWLAERVRLEQEIRRLVQEQRRNAAEKQPARGLALDRGRIIDPTGS